MADGAFMKENGFYEDVARCGVVPVVVLSDSADAVPLARALEEGNVLIEAVLLHE